jgi:hypothetical protein
VSTSIWVVGGGITGCLVALRLARSGHDVCLHEESGSLGGVLRDVMIDGQPWLRGCQFLQPRRMAEAGFDLPAPNEIRRISNIVASATYLPDGLLSASGCEGPVSRESVSEMSIPSDEPECDSGLRRLAAYPSGVRAAMVETLGTAGLDASQIWGPSLVGLQMGRVFFPGQEVESKRLKETSETLSALIGVSPEGPSTLVGLPESGYSEWFRRIHRELIAASVRVHLNSRVRLRLRAGKPEVGASGECRSAPNSGVWCSSPTPLHTFLSEKDRLINHHVHHRYWHLEATAGRGFKDHYVQFFGHPAGIVRATAYTMRRSTRIVVEAVHQSADHSIPLDAVFDAARQLDLRVGKIRAQHGSLNYPTVALTDRKSLGALNSRLHQHNWIGGGWWLYGRARKLQAISDDMIELWGA